MFGGSRAIARALPFLRKARERAVGNRRRSGDPALPVTLLDLAKALWEVPEGRQRAVSVAEEARALWSALRATRWVARADRWLAEYPLSG